MTNSYLYKTVLFLTSSALSNAYNRLVYKNVYNTTEKKKKMIKAEVTCTILTDYLCCCPVTLADVWH